MGKASTVKRIQQLCCLGLPGKAVAPALLRQLHEVVPSYSNILFWIDGKLQFCDLYSEDPDLYGLLPAYFEEFHDEILEKIIRMPLQDFLKLTPRIVHLRALAEDRLDSSSFFNCLMRNIHYHNIVYTRIADLGRPIGLLAQGLEAGKTCLTRLEERTMMKLSPYIAHALCVGSFEEEDGTESEETGLLIFDSSGRLHHSSKKGRELLFLATHANIASGKCEDIHIPAELKNLCHGLARIFNKTPKECNVPIWRKRNDWGSFIFRAYRLECGFGIGDDMVGVTVHKLIPMRLHLWSRIGKLDLTSRQSEACLHLACGLTHAGIAQKMGISMHAANWHIREIYGRLDVSNAADLRKNLLA